MDCNDTSEIDTAAAELRRLAILGGFEAATLVLLICIAVPLKYLFDQPLMVKAIGPVHGLCFLAYLWSIFHHAMAGTLGRKDSLLLALSAFVPFGFLATRGRIIRASRNAPGRP